MCVSVVVALPSPAWRCVGGGVVAGYGAYKVYDAVIWLRDAYLVLLATIRHRQLDLFVFVCTGLTNVQLPLAQGFIAKVHRCVYMRICEQTHRTARALWRFRCIC